MPKKSEVITLPNKLRLATRAMPDSESVTIHVFIGAGGRHEDYLSENGVSHFLEHLLFKGTENYPVGKELSEVIDRVGGYTNAYTTEEYTTFFVKLPKQHLKLGLTVLADIVRRPLFDSVEIDRERGVIIEEMNVFRDDPAQHVHDFVGGLLWPADSLRTDVLGSEHVIRSIPRQVIQAYHAAMYRPDNAVVSVAGNIVEAEVVTAVEELFGDWAGEAARHTQPVIGGLAHAREHIITRDTVQAHIVLAGRGVAHNHPDEFPLHLLGTAMGMGLSSRLSMNIRERQGLAYVIYMRTTNFTDIGKWEIYAGLNARGIEPALESIYNELTEVRKNPLDADELHKVHEQLKGMVIMSQETNGAVADRMGSELLLTGHIQTIDEILTKIDAVGHDDILRVAQRYLDPRGMRLAAIAPGITETALRSDALFAANPN